MAITVDKDGIPTNKPEVTLNDGNVYAVMGACRRAAMKSGWTTGQWAIVRDKFTSSESYDAALQLAMRYFEVV